MAKPADFVVDNASGAAVRTDLNNIFDAISINNGFGTVPTQKYKYMWYADEATSKMSFYKANASDKLDFISLTDGSFFGPNGTASNPSYTFSNSASTGFYRSAANQIGVSNNGANTALFKVDGIDVKGHINVEPTSGEAFVQLKTGVDNEEAYVDFVTDTTTYTDYGLRLERGATGADTDSSLIHRGTGKLQIMTEQVAPISFRTTNTERWQIDSNGAYVWKGHTGSSVTLDNGTIFQRALTSRKGTALNASVANAYNFYWDDSGEGTGKANHLEAWVDTNFVGDVTLGVSDYRIKESITLQTDSGINKVKNLKPITYKYKDYGVLKGSDEIREGFLAHEVQEVIPSAVNREKDVENALQTLNLDAIVSVLTKALQEAVAKIETLETKVAALEGA
jgi:hypothetical protein